MALLASTKWYKKITQIYDRLGAMDNIEILKRSTELVNTLSLRYALYISRHIFIKLYLFIIFTLYCVVLLCYVMCLS